MTTPKEQPKFNLRQLCTNYKVYNDNQTEVKCVSVVEYGMLREIINLQEETCVGNVVEEFSGFVETPWHISWYAQPIETFNLEQAVSQAIKEKNDIVITQILPSVNLLAK